MRFNSRYRAAIGSIALAAALLATASCTSTAGSSTSGGKRVITVAGLADVFQKEYTAAVVEPFNKSQNEIEVKYRGFPTSAEMLSTLRAEKNHPSIDVAIMDLSVSQTGNAEGIYDKLDASAVPNLNELVPLAKNNEGYGPALTIDNLSLIYNTSNGATAPTSWFDMWDPKYKGLVAVDGPPDIRALALITVLAKVEGVDVENPEKAFARFRELAPSVDTWKPNPEVNQYVITHPGSIAIGWNARAQMFAQTSNGVLGVVKVPKEGTMTQSNAINLVAGSKSKDAAQKFINYALSADAQVAFSSRLAYGPVNANAQLKPDAEAKVAEQKNNIFPVDWNFIAKHFLAT